MMLSSVTPPCEGQPETSFELAQAFGQAAAKHAWLGVNGFRFGLVYARDVPLIVLQAAG